MVDDKSKRINCAASRLSVSVHVLKAVYLGGSVEFQLQAVSQINCYPIYCSMHFSLVCSHQKQVIREAQILDTFLPCSEVVKLLEVEIEKPRACIVPQHQAFFFVVSPADEALGET